MSNRTGPIHSPSCACITGKLPLSLNGMTHVSPSGDCSSMVPGGMSPTLALVSSALIA